MRVLLPTLLCGLLLTALPPFAPAQPPPSSERLVLAHFMHQMSIGAECGPGEGPLMPAPSQPNGVMALHLPEFLGEYRQPSAAAKHDIALARACGIDTFAMLLGPLHLPHSQFASVIHAYWTEARRRGDFQMAVDIWMDERKASGGLERLSHGLALLQQDYPSVWRRRDGRLLVFLQTSGNPPSKIGLTSDEIKTLFAGLGGKSAVYLVVYDPVGVKKNNPELFQAADAFTDWPHRSYRAAKLIAEAGADCAREAGKEYIYPAMPSFTQSRPTGGVRPNVREKLGMTNFLEDWQRAIRQKASAVYLETWNDLTEDSAVMPESNHGYAFFDLCTLMAAWFRSGAPPAVHEERILLFHHPETVENLALPPGVNPMPAFAWTQTPPPTDYLGVVVALKEPARVTLQFGEQPIAEKDFTAGLHSWLVYHPAPSSLPETYPTAGETLDVTILPKPFADAEVYLSVHREKKLIGLFRSHRPIAAAAGRGDLTTIGDSFILGK